MQNKNYTYKLKPIIIAILAFEIVFWSLFFVVYMLLREQIEAFKLENADWWFLFLIIPLFIIGFIGNLIWRNRAIKKLASEKLVKHLIKPISSTKVFIKFFFLRNVLVFMLIALLNPQFGKGTQKGVSEGIEIMIALDISNSMRALDLDTQRDRLKIAQMSIERLLNNLHGDKVGLVIFAGDAFVQVPLTTDYGSAKLFLNSVNPDMISNQGTAISAAIETAYQSFDLENGINKSIIIISDGEDHEGAAIELAKKAYADNIIINTVGMGTTKGTVIPNYVNGKRSGLKKDENGNTVTTKINVGMLQDLARAGGGTYVQAQGNYVNLDPLLNQIKGIDKTEMESKIFTDYEDQFQWFIGVGLLFLISYFIFPETKSKLLNTMQDEAA